ncbi:hypothetical protein MCEMIEM13_00749 [Comamonadaceae bacterium]
MNEHVYSENDSKNAFYGIVFGCLSVFFGFGIPVCLLSMDVGNRHLYYKISLAFAIVLVIPSLYYRTAILKVRRSLGEKNQKIIFKRDILLIIVALCMMALIFCFLAGMLFMTTSEGWVYIGYPAYYVENMVIFCVGLFGWLCVMCMSAFSFAHFLLMLLNAAKDWRKLL